MKYKQLKIGNSNIKIVFIQRRMLKRLAISLRIVALKHCVTVQNRGGYQVKVPRARRRRTCTHGNRACACS